MAAADSHDLLHQMMSRLQQAVSGQPTNASAPAAPVGRRPRKVTSAVALVLNNALCNHPVFRIHLSRQARLSSYREALVPALADLQALADGTAQLSDVLRTSNWIQHLAEDLERHRLASTFLHNDAEVLALVEATRSAAHEILGLDDATLPEIPPSLAAAEAEAEDESNHIPTAKLYWPCSVDFHVLFGQLGSLDGRPQRPMSIRNATDVFITNAHRIASNAYDVTSWRAVLRMLPDMPVSQCRSAWEQALFLFPTCGPLVVAYVQREIDQLEGNVAFADTDDVHIAKDQFTARLRVLNVFARHLPLCSSPSLWLLFFSFVYRFVETPDAAIDALFRYALERSAGPCVDSMDLWLEYIRWRSSKIQLPGERFQWVRRTYLRVLALPIDGLARLRTVFDAVEGKDAYGNQKKLDDETELRIAAAKQTGEERRRMFEPMLRAKFVTETEEEFRLAGLSDDEPVDFNEPFIPSPFVAHISRQQRSTVDEDVAREQSALFLRWKEIIESEKDINMSGSRLAKAHAQRVQFFLRMRCHYFPHVVTTWIDAANHAATSFPHEVLKERVQRVLDIFDTATLFHPRSMLLLCAHAEFLMRERVDELRAASTVLSSFAKRLVKEAAEDATGQAVESLAVLYVNWQRWAHNFSESSSCAHLCRLVAKHAVVDTGLLHVIMMTAKRFVKERPATFSPTRHFRAFNVFCAEWMRLELLGLRDPVSALGVFRAWSSHLTKMAQTTHAQKWTLRMCGVDESYVASCRLLCTVHPPSATSALQLLDSLVGAVDAAVGRRRRAFVELDWIRQLVQLVDPARSLCKHAGLDSLLELVDAAEESDDLVADWADGARGLGSALLDPRLKALPLVQPPEGPAAAAALSCSASPHCAALGFDDRQLLAVDSSTSEQEITDSIVSPIISFWPKLIHVPNPAAPVQNRSNPRPRNNANAGRNQEDVEAAEAEAALDMADSGLAGSMVEAVRRKKALERLTKVNLAVAKPNVRRSMQYCLDRLLLEHLRERALREGVEERAKKRIRVEGGTVSPPPMQGQTGGARAAATKQVAVISRREYSMDELGGPVGRIGLLLRSLPLELELAPFLAPPESKSEQPSPGAGIDVSVSFLVDVLRGMPSMSHEV